MDWIKDIWDFHKDLIIVIVSAILIVALAIVIINKVNKDKYEQLISQANIELNSVKSELDSQKSSNEALEIELSNSKKSLRELDTYRSENTEYKERIKELEEENKRLKGLSEVSKETKTNSVLASLHQKITLDDAMVSNLIIAATKLNGTIIKNNYTFDARRLLLDKDKRYEYDLLGDNPGYVNGIEYLIDNLVKAFEIASIEISSPSVDKNNMHYIDDKSNLTFTNNTNKNIIILCSFSNQYLDIQFITY